MVIIIAVNDDHERFYTRVEIGGYHVESKISISDVIYYDTVVSEGWFVHSGNQCSFARLISSYSYVSPGIVQFNLSIRHEIQENLM